MKRLKELELNNEYDFAILEVAVLQENDYSFTEYGPFSVGEHFIVVRDNNDKVYSFILTGYSVTSRGVYKLIYKN